MKRSPKKDESGKVAGSFRDPSGFVFSREGVIYRQINNVYRQDYEYLRDSGLYESLVAAGLLIPHQEVEVDALESDSAFKVIQPENVPFVSYPYEWSFSQLKDAALTTLRIQLKSLEYGISLKDCSAYNIQFVRGRPVFIDTLSFERYQEGKPWVAYRQFCQHFLAPLTLMSRVDVRLSQLLRVHIDGIPLDLTSSLLPMKSKFSYSQLTHLHLHAKSQKHFAHKKVDVSGRRVSKLAVTGIVSSLESAVAKLDWNPSGTEWADYYSATNYSEKGFERKRDILVRFLSRAGGTSAWDFGANVGVFSRVACEQGFNTIAFDYDPASVEKNYLRCRSEDRSDLLPLLLDLTNPSPSLGWHNNERPSLLSRGRPNVVMALALIHHLAISNNVPLRRIARFLRDVGDTLIIEFVPKEDSQVRRLLRSREDIFVHYSRDHFEKEFCAFYSIVEAVSIEGTQRTLYLMRSRP